MKRYRWVVYFVCLSQIMLAACTSLENRGGDPVPTQTPAPTPSGPALYENTTLPTGERLRLTMPSVELLKREPDQNVQILVVLADGQGHSSYVFYPANRPGNPTDLFNLVEFPLELSLTADTSAVTLWVLAIHNTRYLAAEKFGVPALALNLASGFDRWLSRGRSLDDPLAAVVSASGGALYEWFANAEVIGQGVAVFRAVDNWATAIGTHTLTSPDGGLSAIYSIQKISSATAALPPTPTPMLPDTERAGYMLELDDHFEDGTNRAGWFQGQDSTYTNQVVEGAYEISLTDMRSRDFAVSWGSMEGKRYDRYLLEADVRLVETGVKEARYGLWFNYQDGKNFMYFGISNRGEYLVAIFEDNVKTREIQGWTPHPAIRAGANTNTLTIEASGNGQFTLGINGAELISFTDKTYSSGEIAFFCYAESVPATCRLEHLRLWTPAN